MKKAKKDTLSLIEGVFKKRPGSELAKFLKEGACIEACVDGEHFRLEKTDGQLMVTPGEVSSPDISVEMNRAACEYLASSKKLDDFVKRTRECIDGTNPDCKIKYRTAGMPRLLLKGYLDFARKIGII